MNFTKAYRISELESSSPTNRQNSSDEKGIASQRFKSSAEKDKLLIEKCEETIYYLEQTNEGLRVELNKARALIQEEKSFTIKLQAEMNKALHISAQV